jgi:hypothetical protein
VVQYERVKERLYGVVLKEAVGVVGSYWVALMLAMTVDKGLVMEVSQVAVVVMDTEKWEKAVVALTEAGKCTCHHLVSASY